MMPLPEQLRSTQGRAYWWPLISIGLLAFTYIAPRLHLKFQWAAILTLVLALFFGLFGFITSAIGIAIPMTVSRERHLVTLACSVATIGLFVFCLWDFCGN